MSAKLGPLTPQRRRELTRRALVEAAADVFARRGVNGASLEEIAEAAGFTRGAIYSNFKSKEDLLLAVVDWYNTALIEGFTNVLESVSEPEDDTTGTAARFWARAIHGDPNLLPLSLEFRLHAIRNPDFRRRLAELQRQQTQRIAGFVSTQAKAFSNELRLRPEAIADIMWAASEGLLLLAAVDDENAPRYDRLAADFFALMGDALVTPETRSRTRAPTKRSKGSREG